MLLLCALVWGLAFAFQRSAANQINPIAFNGIRFCLASGVICVLLLVYELINKKKGIKSLPWNKSTSSAALYAAFRCFLQAIFSSTG